MKEIITLYNPKLIVIDILYLQTLQTGEPNRNISISNMQNNLYKLSVYQYIYNDYKNIY